VAVVQYTFTHKQYTERQKNKQYVEQKTNNTQNNTKNQFIEKHKKQTIHRTTQKIHRTTQKYNGTVRVVPRLGELYSGICLSTEEKARKKPQSW
jgi:hypothetical protein